MNDFSVLKESGVTQTQFAAMVGVTRVTVNTWVARKFAPNKSKQKLVAAALVALRAAIERKDLPKTVLVRHKTVSAYLDTIFDSNATQGY
jgi:DNA-binding XRE family transcriptional regulator